MVKKKVYYIKKSYTLTNTFTKKKREFLFDIISISTPMILIPIFARKKNYYYGKLLGGIQLSNIIVNNVNNIIDKKRYKEKKIFKFITNKDIYKTLNTIMVPVLLIKMLFPYDSNYYKNVFYSIVSQQISSISIKTINKYI